MSYYAMFLGRLLQASVQQAPAAHFNTRVLKAVQAAASGKSRLLNLLLLKNPAAILRVTVCAQIVARVIMH